MLLFASGTSVCQYPLLRSMVERRVASLSESMHSSIRGSGCVSRVVVSLSLLQSTQERSFPLFFGASTVGLVHSDITGSVAPSLSMQSISCLSCFLFVEPAQY